MLDFHYSNRHVQYLHLFPSDIFVISLFRSFFERNRNNYSAVICCNCFVSRGKKKESVCHPLSLLHTSFIADTLFSLFVLDSFILSVNVVKMVSRFLEGLSSPKSLIKINVDICHSQFLLMISFGNHEIFVN